MVIATFGNNTKTRIVRSRDHDRFICTAIFRTATITTVRAAPQSQHTAER